MAGRWCECMGQGGAVEQQTIPQAGRNLRQPSGLSQSEGDF